MIRSKLDLNISDIFSDHFWLKQILIELDLEKKKNCCT